VEAVPGIAPAVRAHQTWGERTRNVVSWGSRPVRCLPSS
jgi:hypothetical protein